MFEVISIGSAVLDIFVKSKDFKVVENKEFEGGEAICQVYGGKIDVDDLVMATGGGGTNTAVAFSRLGYKVAVVAEMGDDFPAMIIRKELKNERVDRRFLVVEEDETTGVSVVLVASEGGRSIVSYRGASRMLTREDIDWKGLEQTKWIHMGALGGEVELAKAVLSFGMKQGIKVSWNPGKKEMMLLKEGGDEAVKIFSLAEIVVMNMEEANSMGLVRLKALMNRKTLVVTNGKAGGMVFELGKEWDYKALRCQTVNETGAGDAFTSGYIGAHLSGLGVERAIDWGRKNAVSVVQHMGAKKGLLTRNQMERFRV